MGRVAQVCAMPGALSEDAMSNLREALSSTAMASLEWSEERERAIDRIAASGKAPTLGVLIWKARYMLESRAYQDARSQLVRLFLTRYTYESPSIAEKCVDEALHEFMGPACQRCSGARELVSGDLRVECPDCHGSGLRRYTDWERAARMGMSMHRAVTLSRKLRWIAEEMQSLDRAVNSVLCHELERE